MNEREARATYCGTLDGCDSLQCQLCLARDTMRRLSAALRERDEARAECERLQAKLERMSQWRDELCC